MFNLLSRYKTFSKGGKQVGRSKIYRIELYRREFHDGSMLPLSRKQRRKVLYNDAILMSLIAVHRSSTQRLLLALVGHHQSLWVVFDHSGMVEHCPKDMNNARSFQDTAPAHTDHSMRMNAFLFKHFCAFFFIKVLQAQRFVEAGNIGKDSLCFQPHAVQFLLPARFSAFIFLLYWSEILCSFTLHEPVLAKIVHLKQKQRKNN